MQSIVARNVHQAFPKVMLLLKRKGVKMESRNGPVLKVPGPVSICYERPTERVIFWPKRDANPFFHLLEALWMLCGRNDVEFMANILPNMVNYSDDGEIFNGAYGFRWRKHFWYDQLPKITAALSLDRYDRRQVLAIWDGFNDLGLDSKDIPCNTQAFFSRADTGALDMTVTNRSNDVVWGALGANAVHFSVLQEYLAAMIGCKVGKYWQVTNNLHLYLDHHVELMNHFAGPFKVCPYESGAVKPTPLIPGGNAAKFTQDILMLLDEGMSLGISDWFVRKIANPMLCTTRAYKTDQIGKDKRINIAMDLLSQMWADSDWRLAGEEWLMRRAK